MSDWKEVAEEGQVSTWKPEEGEELVGKLTRVDEGVGANKSTIYEITMESGEKVVVWETAVLKSKLDKVQLLSDVKIIYKGKRKSKNGLGSYKDYQVFAKTSQEQEVRKAFDADVPF